MRLPERLLLFFSPRELEKKEMRDEWTTDNSLDLSARFFPNFFQDIKGKTILDFGCGYGFQSIALVQKDADFVVGVDIKEKCLEKGKKLAANNKVDKKIQFTSKLGEKFHDYFDIALSHNSFEHFDDPAQILEELKLVLKKRGKIYISFGPPWFAPFGVHNYFFIKIPWANILFSERTIMSVRCLYTKETVTKYEEIGLNKMTIKKFEKLIANSGMDIEYIHYEAVKGLNFLGKIPFLRELFINHVSCILVKN